MKGAGGGQETRAALTQEGEVEGNWPGGKAFQTARPREALMQDSDEAERPVRRAEGGGRPPITTRPAHSRDGSSRLEEQGHARARRGSGSQEPRLAATSRREREGRRGGRGVNVGRKNWVLSQEGGAGGEDSGKAREKRGLGDKPRTRWGVMGGGRGGVDGGDGVGGSDWADGAARSLGKPEAQGKPGGPETSTTPRERKPVGREKSRGGERTDGARGAEAGNRGPRGWDGAAPREAVTTSNVNWTAGASTRRPGVSGHTGQQGQGDPGRSAPRGSR